MVDGRHCQHARGRDRRWRVFRVSLLHRDRRRTDDAAQALKAAQGSEGLTADELAGINGTDLYFAVFKNAAQQPIVGATRETVSVDIHNPQFGAGIYGQNDFRRTNAAFDFGSELMSYETASLDPTGVLDGASRCVDGNYYTLTDGAWEHRDDDEDCANTEEVWNRYAAAFTDGLNTGGLTKEQADAFVLDLIEENVISAKKSTLAEVSGKQYIRLAVELTPKLIEDSEDYPAGTYAGLQHLMWSLKEAGVDPSAHPYEFSGAFGEGVRMVMYVDPATVLPAYAQITNTPVPGMEGEPIDRSAQTAPPATNGPVYAEDFSGGVSSENEAYPNGAIGTTRVEYHFYEKLPAFTLDSADNPRALTWQPIAGDWPPTLGN